jgi:hypothetical protein
MKTRFQIIGEAHNSRLANSIPFSYVGLRDLWHLSFFFFLSLGHGKKVTDRVAAVQPKHHDGLSFPLSLLSFLSVRHGKKATVRRQCHQSILMGPSSCDLVLRREKESGLRKFGASPPFFHRLGRI